jgi:hypothetical protein
MEVTMSDNILESLSNPERLSAYNRLMAGCTHMWSKNKMQQDKVLEVLREFIELGYQDPFFLAHLTAYIHKNSDSKDLKVVSAYVNALNSADGQPFSPKSKLCKPNLRYVSYSVLQRMDPKLVDRILDLTRLKFDVPNRLQLAAHTPTGLITAVHKYIRIREKNPKALEGIRKSGMRNIFMNMYRKSHISPSDDAASILKWKQKDGREIELKRNVFDFSGLTPQRIAEKIIEDNLSVLGCLGALEKITPSIAIALLTRASGNEALILHKVFEDQGLLDNEKVMALYTEKIKTAGTSIDRVKNLSKTAGEAIKKAMASAKSDVRKEQTGDIGKVFMHIDISGSMDRAIEYAKENGSIIAECVKNPERNFKWGLFNTSKTLLPMPNEFSEAGFSQVLFGRRAGGGTDIFSMYPDARQFGATVDIYITDQQNTCGSLSDKIRNFHNVHQDLPKPECIVIVYFPDQRCHDIEQACKDNNIPYVVIRPETLTNTALVAEAIKTAVKGPLAKIDEIMGTELPNLPDWYYAVDEKKDLKKDLVKRSKKTLKLNTRKKK